MTPIQQKTIDQAFEMLGEHFPAFVLITLNDAGHDSERQCETEECRISFEGGMHQALGMITDAQHTLVTRGMNRNDNDGEDWKEES